MTEDARSEKLLLDGISKKYGDFTALKPTQLTIMDGEFLTLLGPSGSGKTTLLQIISGLVEPTTGKMFFEGEDWTNRPVNSRGMGMVFQHYALFPHMTVSENIAFPLKMRSMSQSEISRQVSETLAKVQLGDFGHRFPRELSGGQQQRVALARCFVYRPKIILMDEPLGALDKSLRENMQLEIRRLHQEFGTTVIYVTHDQVEAMTMADRIVVMRDGRILQTGTPTELYENPTDVFTARFIGSPSMNLIAGRRNGSGVELAPDGDILVGVRPHDLKVEEGTANGLSLTGTVTAVEPLGAETLVHLDVNGVSVIATAPGKVIPATGGTLSVSAPAGSLYLFDAKTEKSLGRL